MLTTPLDGSAIEDKRRCAAWSPAVLHEGRRRGNDHVEAVSCIVLDYDDGTDLLTALDPWRDWPCIYHTSWSCTDDVAKYRLVVPLARPVPALAWRWVWRWAAQRAGGTIDPACSDASRLYFLPHRRPGAPFDTGTHDPGGALCDPDWHLVDAGTLAAVGRSTDSVARERDWEGRDYRATASTAQRVAAEALRADPAVRERVGSALRGVVRGTRCHGIRCPACGRASVWFLIDPRVKATAECNHRNSCGWYGHLDQLLRGQA
jgi:hypothetical protein